MSIEIVVICDRCQDTSPGRVSVRGRPRAVRKGWRCMGRDVDLCARCAAVFDMWWTDSRDVAASESPRRSGE
jgi:hypothetical protein